MYIKYQYQNMFARFKNIQILLCVLWSKYGVTVQKYITEQKQPVTNMATTDDIRPVGTILYFEGAQKKFGHYS